MRIPPRSYLPVKLLIFSFELIPPEPSAHLTCLDRIYIKSLWIKMHEFALGEAGVMHLA